VRKDYAFMVQEKEKWVNRKKELEAELVSIDEEERRLLGELVKMREQVSYYDSLTRDMKRQMQPADVSNMMKGF